jgi:hypothetical protein
VKAWKTIGAFALAAAGVVSMIAGVSMGTHQGVGGRLAVILAGASMISTGVLLLIRDSVENWLDRLFSSPAQTSSENSEPDARPGSRVQRKVR